MSGQRTYRQNCGLARALDVLGERWTILVVRELCMGPRRYKDLLEALPGIGTNMLAARLKTLESSKVIRSVVLPQPASTRAYELTDLGAKLRPILGQLGVWGFQLDVPIDDDAESRASWLMQAMLATADPAEAAALDAIVEVRAGTELMWIKADSGGVDLRCGTAGVGPDLVIDTDLPTFIALAFGGLSPTQAVKNGALRVGGNRKLLSKFFHAFRIRRPSSH
ncbi:winged helix-turn-helix transcriptional regulator [Mycobacterium spongiae]|uniref:HTH hxlR-type domain-containing protein n=1 Tax=Mycobacterium spongiae TaxID=886343 RepID=A0A975PVQ0_9MYCO|nr:winged helix-turn-helix transcriptional regulator [Mycobacterium spongiae]QUR66386.1 hypothetical protein F6B93_04155 [Mycobacterium spongiae]